MSVSTQLLDTLHTIFDSIDNEIPDYTVKWRTFLATKDANEVLTYLQSVLAPLAGAIQTKNEDEMLRIRPDDNLEPLLKLKPDTKEAIWAQLSLIVTLCTTLSMLPPDMITQIDSLVSNPEMSNLVANLFGNMGNDDAKQTSKPSNSAQNKMRRLV